MAGEAINNPATTPETAVSTGLFVEEKGRVMTYRECRERYGTVTDPHNGTRYIRVGIPQHEGGADWEAPLEIDAPEILDWPVISPSAWAQYPDCRCRPDAKRLLSPDWIISEGRDVSGVAREEMDAIAPRDCVFSVKRGGDPAQFEAAAEMYRAACERFGVKESRDGFLSFALNNNCPRKKFRIFRTANPESEIVQIVESFAE